MFPLGSSYPSAMARLARIVVPGIAHHVTARDNRREPIFFEHGDQDLYGGLLSEQTRKARRGMGMALPDAQSCTTEPDRRHLSGHCGPASDFFIAGVNLAAAVGD